MKQIDRIKQMDAQEMAEFLEQVISGNREALGIACGQDSCSEWKCTECIWHFLESIV